ncbi:MAG TPA: response regulator [Candidatus Saccharimonadales bacterium]|nr:response regulator [Candidatus Saccharimonadales bacterium]
MGDNQTWGAGKTVLIADSDEFITVAYRDGMENAGFQVIIANDGEHTLELLKSESPDAVLLELILPEVNGFEILQFMKKSKSLKHVPVVVLTNLSQASDEAEAREYGAADFLVKSETTVQDMLARLESLLAENL